MAKSKKAKASKNKAKDVEQKKQQSSEELAFALNQNYNQLMQAQANIQAINKELERRQVANSKVKE